MKNKFILNFILLLLLSSCSGFNSKRSDKVDEFLIEKKNPLVMPPEINELPKPSKENTVKNEKEDEEFKEILKSKDATYQAPISNNNTSLSESIIKKIED